MSESTSLHLATPPLCIYEQPLNERLRLFMRLESMFAQMKNFRYADEYYSIQLFLDALFDVLDFLHRYEIRSEIIKELQKIKSLIEQGNLYFSGLDQEKSQLQQELERSLTELHELNLNSISALRENELFNSLRQRNFNQSGNCLFEVPAYQHWLLKNGAKHSPFLLECYELFLPIARAVLLILRLVRHCTELVEVVAEEGMYLKTLDHHRRYQMIRIHLSHELALFPRISGDKHRFAIRFMRQDDPVYRAVQVNENVEFSLQTCAM